MAHPHTPYYSYDRELLSRTLSAALRASELIADSHIHFALKANSNPAILGIIAASGIGADCVSGGEIRLALNAGFRAADIVYSGVGKTDDELALAIESGIGCINAESIEELAIISEIAVAHGKVAHVSLRINPDIGAHTHSNITTGLAENKFGINQEKVEYAVRRLFELPGIEFRGIHFHIGSQILDMSDFMALCNRIGEWQKWFFDRGINLPSINVGGGLGVDYEHPSRHPIPDFESYFYTFSKHLKLFPGQQFHCELGRSLVAQCGSLITRCILVKEGTFKTFIIVDAGMNDLIRPALYQAYHKIENITNPDAQPQLYDVVGPICESTDTFAKGVYVAGTKRGDLLAIRSAGAYGESMASTYNSRPLPEAEII